MSDRQPSANSNTLPRDPKLRNRPFILDELMSKGKDLLTEHKIQYTALRPTREDDKDIDGPYQDILNLCREKRESFPELAQQLTAELKEVRDLVESCCSRGWQGIQWGQASGTPSKYANSKQKKSKAENTRIFLSVAAEFTRGPDKEKVPILSGLGLLDKVKASYVYRYKPKYAFAVAFRTLCTIKAEAKGLAPITQTIGQILSVPSAAVRILSAQAVEFGAVLHDIP